MGCNQQPNIIANKNLTSVAK